MLKFAGSNPCVVLYDEDGEVLTAASFWDADYTPLGPGQVLFLMLGPSVTAYSANRSLAEFCWTFNQHFGGFEKASLNAHTEADFRLQRGKDSVRLDCTADAEAVRVDWQGLGVPSVNRSPVENFGNKAGRSYEVTSTVCPVAQGSISLSGARLPGAVIDDYGDLPRSAFLAWAETWVSSR